MSLTGYSIESEFRRHRRPDGLTATLPQRGGPIRASHASRRPAIAHATAMA